MVDKTQLPLDKIALANPATVQRFAKTLHKCFTRTEEQLYTLGWEWEIPYRDSHQFSRDAFHNQSALTAEQLHEMGMMAHMDSGGWEIGSPIFDSVATAKRFARYVKERAAEETSFFLPDSDTRGYCGIHVHASHRDNPVLCDNEDYFVAVDRGEYWWRNRLHYQAENVPGFKPAYLTSMLADFVLNRQENREWLRIWSGRRENQQYAQNAAVTGWDRERQVSDIASLNQAMVRFNTGGYGTPVTTEFRIWKGIANRLEPAIDFGHAYYRWCRQQARRLVWEDFVPLTGQRMVFTPRTAEEHRDGDRSSYSGYSRREKRVLNEMLPPFSDFIDWLDRRKGYSVLKADLIPVWEQRNVAA